MTFGGLELTDLGDVLNIEHGKKSHKHCFFLKKVQLVILAISPSNLCMKILSFYCILEKKKSLKVTQNDTKKRQGLRAHLPRITFSRK